jgi:hypothetical protein
MRLDLRLRSVLFTRGHDGFLRGWPEPALLVAAWLPKPELKVAVAVVGLDVRTPFPCTRELNRSLLSARQPSSPKVAVLTVGFEHDSGADIERAARELETAPGAWTLRADGALAVPFSLEEVHHVRWAGPPAGQPVIPASRGRDLAELSTADDWVGAGLVVCDASRSGSQRSEQRLVSADGRNDWTVRLELKLSS